MWNFFKRLMGVATMLFGLILLAWIVYNQLLSTDEFWKGPSGVLHYITPIACLFVGWKWWRGKSEQTGQIEAGFSARLKNPDFRVVEDHFGVVLPTRLKEFYGTELVERDFEELFIGENEWSIAFFEPVDGNSIREGWPGCEEFLSIANDGCGNDYFFNPKLPPHPIFFHDHETGEFSKVVDSLDDFLDIIETCSKRPN